MNNEVPTKTVRQAIEDLNRLGPIRDRPSTVTRCVTHAVSEEEYETALDGLAAIGQQYAISLTDMTLLRNALTWAIHYRFFTLDHEAAAAALQGGGNDDLKWQ